MCKRGGGFFRVLTTTVVVASEDDEHLAHYLTILGQTKKYDMILYCKKNNHFQEHVCHNITGTIYPHRLQDVAS